MVMYRYTCSWCMDACFPVDGGFWHPVGRQACHLRGKVLAAEKVKDWGKGLENHDHLPESQRRDRIGK